MKLNTMLMTMAGLAMAGVAMACDCAPKAEKTTLTKTDSDVVVVTAGNKEGESKEIRVTIDDGEIRYWVNGEEVDADEFAKISEKIMIHAPKAAKTAKVGKAKWAGKLDKKKDHKKQGQWHSHGENEFIVHVDAPEPPAPSGPVRLGVMLGEISDALAVQMDVDGDEVILIEKVLSGSAAEKAGLESYDVLVEFDGEDGLTVDRLRGLLAKKSHGDTAEVEVLRGGDELDFIVKFEVDGEPTAKTLLRRAEPAAKPRRAPRAQRFFAEGLHDEHIEHIERAMREAELHAAQAQKQVMKWANKNMDFDKDGNTMTFSFEFDEDSQEAFEEAMEHLHELMEDQDFDFNVDFEHLPRIKFFAPDADDQARHERESAVLLEKRMMNQERSLRQQERKFEREAERAMELAERHAEKVAKLAERHAEQAARMAEEHIAQLESKIAALEEQLAALMDKLHDQHEEKKERKGFRN